MGRVRILVADEQTLFREALKVFLSGEEDLVVVAEAQDGLRAVGEAERWGPDVAILGTNLPNCDGIGATALIKERVPGCRVLLLADVEDQATLIEALEAGASGFLTKESPMAELVEAMHALARGAVVIPPDMMPPLLSGLLHRRREQDRAFHRVGRLTRREREVLGHLAEGADNDAIAQRLVISPQTARTHIQNLITKLGVHSRLEAVALVTQNRLQGELVGADG
jgi:DNA-binding NarL/FixJ family response regulator